MTPHAELITIGDEILFGHIVDTNAQWMAERLADIGLRVIHKTTVGDSEDDILNALQLAEKRAQVVLITGGLGPTKDDLTKACLAKYFDCPLVLNEEALKEVTALFEQRGRTLTEINRQQAYLPACCKKITNHLGTAAGIWFEQHDTIWVSMPGVPNEMKHMMTDAILPQLKSKLALPIIFHKTILTSGIPESYLADKISEWAHQLPDHFKLAYLPNTTGVKLRLTAAGNSQEQLSADATKLIATLTPLIDRYIYGYDDDTLEAVVGKLLTQKNYTLSLAESCTGGYVSHRITSVAGCSTYFKGGMVVYSNDMKTHQLGVDAAVLEQEGAVSEAVVIAMSENIRKCCNTDVGAAISGIAGPDGGTSEKPVGLIWIACSVKGRTKAVQLQFGKHRQMNIERTSAAVLNLIRLMLLEKEDE